MNDLIAVGPVSPLRQRLIDDMTMRRFSRETQRNYLRDVGRFATWLGRSPHTATAEDVRRLPEMKRLLDATTCLKHQAALSVAYGAGLRVAEVILSAEETCVVIRHGIWSIAPAASTHRGTTRAAPTLRKSGLRSATIRRSAFTQRHHCPKSRRSTLKYVRISAAPASAQRRPKSKSP